MSSSLDDSTISSDDDYISIGISAPYKNSINLVAFDVL
jgi:hypothetical protein